MSQGDERIHAASSFVLQAPPGEINDVLNDVRVIVNDDETLEQGILPAVRGYNLEQFITVDVPGTTHQTVVSDAARITADGEEEERFLDPRSKQSFKFDHLRLYARITCCQEATDLRPEEPDSEAEPLRAALESSALSYLSSHYYDGVAAVFSVQSPNRFVAQIVANKYNPSNYWSGRWRSHYDIHVDSQTIRGRVLLNIHYYEQGNVQLETSHDLTIPIPSGVVSAAPGLAASKIFALIEAEESELQKTLQDAYTEMSEKAFKGLRRALPLTRQKVDWDKPLAYKLGAELSATKGTFANS